MAAMDTHYEPEEQPEEKPQVYKAEDLEAQKLGDDALKELTTINWDRPAPGFVSEFESQQAIAKAVSHAMQKQDLTPFEVYEMCGVLPEVVQAMLDGEYNVRDSLDLTRVEAALRVSLRDL